MKLYSGNAVTAKIMAMHGKRLTPRDYDNLLEKSTVGEVAAYLKMETGYAPLLSDIRENQVHREQLENAIRRHMLDICLKLSRYSHSDGFFLRFFLMRSEIDQLLQAIRYLSSGEMERYVVAFPAYLSSHMSFDLFELAGVRSFNGLLDLLRRTDYYNVLLPCRPEVGAGVDVTACETALLTRHYRNALAIVEKSYPRKAGDSLRRLLYMEINLHNIALLIRMKRFQGMTPAHVSQYLIGVETGFGRKALDDIITVKDIVGVKERLRTIPELRGCAEDDGLEVEFAFERQRQRTCRKALRYSQQPAASFMAFMTMLRIETSNIINIIEGMRYGLPADEIRGMLVI